MGDLVGTLPRHLCLLWDVMHSLGRSGQSPALPSTATVSLTPFGAQEMHRGLQVQAVWQAGIWDDFLPVGGCVGFKTAGSDVRGAPSPSTPPPPGRMSPQEQVEGLPS